MGGGRVRDHFDWPLFLVIVAIAIVGVVNLYSATSPYIDDPRRAGLADVYVQQVYWLVVGGLAGTLAAAIDYRTIQRMAYVLYVGGIASLLLVFVVASDVRGSARWINIGRFAFQPSEFMKILLILAIARRMASDSKAEARTLVDLLPAALLFMLPAALVMLQPDFGTSMIYTTCAATMLALTSIRRSSIAALLVFTVPVAWGMWQFGLREYQRGRVLSFLNPEADRAGTGWHALQSRTAIGNGGIWGEGFREGSQNQFGFLPDQYSDFPFSVFAEDWGFVGCLVLLALYAFVCAWAVNIASMAKDRFGAAVAIGVGATFFWHTFFNIGMTVGILPVVGITLPLFSYGGSSTLTTMVGFGLLMNISLRR